MTIAIIGIDCATKDSKIGLCLAEAGPDRVRILRVASGKGITPTDQQVVEWIKGKESAILALDAPLGWPAPLASFLPQHQAGSSIQPQPDFQPDFLFRRETDRFVEKELDKCPLEIGANLIARTAYAALGFLSTISEGIDSEIPLAWDPNDLPRFSAIEVYPAATLKAHSVELKSYKGNKREKIKHEKAMTSMLEKLQEDIEIRTDQSVIVSDDNLFDAVVCALAAYDFVTGKAIPPVDFKLARKEGWIWFRRPDNPR